MIEADVRGVEADWIASDAEGHVALFSTAGGGWAPPAFLADVEGHARAIEAILGLPTSTRVRFAPELDATYTNTWKLVAERGLFAFDADYLGGPYRLIAAPVTPARVGDLPAHVTEIVRNVELHHLTFANLSTISAATLAAQDEP